MGTINLVLYEPEIPQNTGNIMRTCVATNTVLHLIEPLGFSLDEKMVKRCGANYINETVYYTYKNFDEFMEKNKDGEFYFLTRYGEYNLHGTEMQDVSKNYYFVLGKESSGIPKEILQKNIARCVRLPMTEKVRALNVSNVAAICIYECLRQQNFPNLSNVEPEIYKGKNYLKN